VLHEAKGHLDMTPTDIVAGLRLAGTWQQIRRLEAVGELLARSGDLDGGGSDGGSGVATGVPAAESAIALASEGAGDAQHTGGGDSTRTAASELREGSDSAEGAMAKAISSRGVPRIEDLAGRPMQASASAIWRMRSSHLAKETFSGVQGSADCSGSLPAATSAGKLARTTVVETSNMISNSIREADLLASQVVCAGRDAGIGDGGDVDRKLAPAATGTSQHAAQMAEQEEGLRAYDPDAAASSSLGSPTSAVRCGEGSAEAPAHAAGFRPLLTPTGIAAEWAVASEAEGVGRTQRSRAELVRRITLPRSPVSDEDLAEAHKYAKVAVAAYGVALYAFQQRNARHLGCLCACLGPCKLCCSATHCCCRPPADERIAHVQVRCCCAYAPCRQAGDFARPRHRSLLTWQERTLIESFIMKERRLTTRSCQLLLGSCDRARGTTCCPLSHAEPLPFVNESSSSLCCPGMHSSRARSCCCCAFFVCRCTHCRRTRRSPERAPQAVRGGTP
jgi:hypothetical protein